MNNELRTLAVEALKTFEMKDSLQDVQHVIETVLKPIDDDELNQLAIDVLQGEREAFQKASSVNEVITAMIAALSKCTRKTDNVLKYLNDFQKELN